MDGYSCGVYALAGMLALAHGNMNWTLSAAQAACMRQDLCQSIIDVTLITHHSLHNTAHIPEHPSFAETTEIPLNSKRKYATQSLITDSFKRQRDNNTTVGHQDLKCTLHARNHPQKEHGNPPNLGTILFYSRLPRRLVHREKE